MDWNLNVHRIQVHLVLINVSGKMIFVEIRLVVKLIRL